jgi:hypothetical protein
LSEEQRNEQSGIPRERAATTKPTVILDGGFRDRRVPVPQPPPESKTRRRWFSLKKVRPVRP